MTQTSIFNIFRHHLVFILGYTIFYRQLNFSSEPRVANEILDNEPKSCLTAA